MLPDKAAGNRVCSLGEKDSRNGEDLDDGVVTKVKIHYVLCQVLFSVRPDVEVRSVSTTVFSSLCHYMTPIFRSKSTHAPKNVNLLSLRQAQIPHIASTKGIVSFSLLTSPMYPILPSPTLARAAGVCFLSSIGAGPNTIDST